MADTVSDKPPIAKAEEPSTALKAEETPAENALATEKATTEKETTEKEETAEDEEEDDRSDRSASPDFEFSGGGRPLIKKYKVVPSKYRPGQVVYLRVPGHSSLEGPYKVATAKNKKYTLAHSNGRTARGGAEVDEDDLVKG
ncbi:hypothetical protein ACJ41O_001409 [Fusarium nematophilum]